MTRRWRSSIYGGLFAVVLFVSPLGAQTAQPDSQSADPKPAQAPASTDETAPPVPVTALDLARIRKALDSEPAVRLDGDQVRFYVQVVAKPLTFAEFAKGYDFVNGPTRRGNPMTHNEFLAMVTPREMQSQVGITARETLEFAITGWVGEALVKKAYEELKNARSEREIQQIRERIERELAELRASEAP